MDHLGKIHSIKVGAENANDEVIAELTKKHSSTEQAKRTKVLIEFIIGSFQPFSIVNSNSFLKF